MTREQQLACPLLLIINTAVPSVQTCRHVVVILVHKKLLLVDQVNACVRVSHIN